MKWIKNNEYLLGVSNEFEFKTKLALFDLDNTLIVTKSGKKFAINEDDWIFRFKNVKTKLSELKDYCIVIVSNQAGIDSGKEKPDRWIRKLDNIQKKLNLDLYVFCSTGHNIYRKPFPTFFLEIIPDHDQIDFENSFFCGDSAGRKNDYRDTDYKFALNCGLKFLTPELFFEGKQSRIPKIEYPNVKDIKNTKLKFAPQEKEIIIMVGFPASGKSYVSKLIHDTYKYEIINQDILKTKAKCIKFAINLIGDNKSLIIDATNPSSDTRKTWIDLAKKHNYTVRVINMTTSLELSKHNNSYRYLKNKQNYIPEIAYNIFKSKFEVPNLNEGIKEIIKMNQLGKPKDEFYHMFLY